MELDQAQQAAVQYNQGPLLIRAGPGSGKTRVITERVKRIIDSGIKPEEILCLTFTRKATGEMLQRLERDNIVGVNIHTFHSFAKSILEDHVLESGTSLRGILEQSSIYMWAIRNIDSFNFEYVKIGNNITDIVKSIVDGIKLFKNELISTTDLEDYLTAKRSKDLDEKQQETIQNLNDLNKMYVKFQEFWRSTNLIDFNDILVEVVELLENNKSIQTKLRSQFKHILIDEFQDNNYAQMQLVKLISTDGNVTAVGDDDQSIFGFQGAYTEIFRDFEKYFTGTEIITLNQNYRSTKNIVSLTSELISSIEERATKELSTRNVHGNTIKVCECSSESAQAEYVVNTIKELLKTPLTKEDGTEYTISPNDIAILFRTKKSAFLFTKLLKFEEIPVTFMISDQLFKGPIIQDLMAYLQIVADPVRSGNEIIRLMKNHGIDDYNISDIDHHAKKISNNRVPGVDFILKSLHEISKNNPQWRTLREFVDVLDKLGKISSLSITDIVYEVVTSISGLYKNSLADDSLENRVNRAALKKIIEFAQEYEQIYSNHDMVDFVDYLKILLDLDLNFTDESKDDDGIFVNTIHQSKGKEFQAVFVVDVAEGSLPLRPKSKKFRVPNDLVRGIKITGDEKELHYIDEKKLFYVAMTRAKSHLYITYARNYEDRKTEAKPSRFLEELKHTTNPLVDFTKYESTTSISAIPFEHFEHLKNEYQKLAINAINQMNLSTAAQNIVDLAKIKHFETYENLNKFDHKKLLDVNPKSNIDSQLRKQPSQKLIKSDNFSLSSSKYTTFDDCPLQFKFKYVLEAPGKPRQYLSFGNNIHSAIENIEKLQKDHVTISEELISKILKKYWNSLSYDTKSQENEYQDTANEMIHRYLQWHNSNPNLLEDIEVEFTINFHGVKIKGKIDRVEITPDGEYEVIDFKTGKSKTTKNKIKDDIQLNIYALGVQELYGKLPKKISLFYLVDGDIRSYYITREDLDNFETRLSDMNRSIFDERFVANPAYHCKYCDYAAICDERYTR